MNADITKTDWAPRVLVLLCNWPLYTQSDLAEVAKTREIPQVRVLKVPCAGRINPLFILMALQEGNDGVLVVGCPPESCHYKAGNYLSNRKLVVLKRFLEYLGMEEGRVRFEWIANPEQGGLSRLVREHYEHVKQFGPVEKLVRSHFASGPLSYSSP